MKRVALCLLLFCVALGARAQSPDAEFLQIYGLIQEGESLERSDRGADAADRFRTAQHDLEKFAKVYPSWNSKIVKFRLSYLAGKLAGAAGKPETSPLRQAPVEAVTAVATPAGPAAGLALELSAARDRAAQAESRADQANARANVAEDRNGRLALDLRSALDRVDVLQSAQQNLEANRLRLESERSTLEARLKEALGPKPAALDPAELSRAQERNVLLMKENEILKASLDHQMTEYKRLAEKAGKALELEKQLGVARTELASLRRENDDLRSERQKLAAKVESMGRKADPSAALRTEIETLKRELAAARSNAPSANPDSDLGRLQAELAKQREATEALRADNATLVREVEKLSAIQVSPASLKQPEVAPAELAVVEGTRIRQLERERDTLQRALDAARTELQRRNGAGDGHGGELSRKVERLEAQVASLEAKPEPYTPEELALFQAPSRPVELARNSLPSGGAGVTPVQVAQASPPTPATPPAGDAGKSTNAPASAAGNTAPAAASAPAPAGGSKRRTMRDLPPGAGVLAAQAQRAFAQRRFDDAEKTYREILKMDERNVFTLGNLAAILVERGRLEEGEDILKRALDADSQDPFSLSLLGIIRFRQQRYDEAFDALSRSAQLDPDNADTQNYLGITLSQRGQRKAAEAALRKALKLSPASPAAHYNLAVVYATQKPPFLELAKYHYEKARRSGQPANPAFEGVLRGEPQETAAP